MLIADTNVILRYLLNDDEKLSYQATQIIENNTISVPVAIACEVVFVLQKVYELERENIRDILATLVESEIVFIERSDLFLNALDHYRQTRLDFVDCLLWAYKEIDQVTVFTFDKKLNKYIGGELIK